MAAQGITQQLTTENASLGELIAQREREIQQLEQLNEVVDDDIIEKAAGDANTQSVATFNVAQSMTTASSHAEGTEDT